MADGVIDSLSIEIEASSSKAAQEVNKLKNALEGLKGAVSGFKLGDFKKEMDKLGNAQFGKIEKLAKALQGLKGANVSSTLGTNLTNLAAALDMIDQQHIDKLTRFGQAMQNLKSVSTSGYNTLPASIMNIAAAVDSITDDTIMRLHRLTLALSRLRGVDLSGLAAVLNAQRRANAGRTGGKGGAGGNGGGNAGPASSGQSGAGGGKSPVIDAALTGLKAVGSVLKTVLSTVGKIAKGIAKWAFKTVLNTVKKIAGFVGKIAKGIADFAKAKIKNWWDNTAFAGIERTLGRINKIISSFGRIAFYRAIRTAIKYVTDMLKEGTERAYWYSKLFGDATRYIAEAYDELESKNFKMSNQLGAAWATLIAKIQPILLQIISLVTKAAEVVTQFFAILSGKTTYLKAIDYTKDWADETDKGSKAAKEWKNQLMGFDEINRLEAPSDSNRGSGNDDYTDYENMFEEAEITSNFLQELRDALDNGEWARVGQLFGERLNTLINDFDWSGWGERFGQKIKAAIEISFNFLKTADFKNLGSKIAEFLNSAGDQINFETLGRLATRIKTALLDIVYGAVSGLNWKQLAINLSNYFLGALQEWIDWISDLDPAIVAQAIKDFFGNIKYEEIKEKFVTLVKTAWEKAIELKDELFPEGMIATVTGHIVDFFSGLNWEEIKNTIGEKLKSAWTTITTAIDTIWPPSDREAFATSIKEKLTEIIQNAMSKLDLGAIHNILAYKLDEAVFGTDMAKRIWYNKGEFAGRDLILGTEYGMEQQKAELDMAVRANITDPVSQALYDMEHQAEVSGENSSTEIKNAFKGMGGSVNSTTAGMKSDVGSLSTTVSTETGNITRNTSSVTTAMNDMSTRSGSAMSSMNTAVQSNSNGIIGHLQGIISWAQQAWSWLNSIGDAGQARIDANGGIWSSLGGFATGGFPEDGLFMANHGELVGRFSNGKTAVANNEQITEGIADAVYGAFMNAFSATGGGNENGQPVNIYLDGRLLAKSNTRYQQQFARVNG